MTLHKTRYTESDRRESWKEPQNHWHREKFSMPKAIRSRINQWELMKVERFCKAKNIVNRMNSQPTDFEKQYLH